MEGSGAGVVFRAGARRAPSQAEQTFAVRATGDPQCGQTVWPWSRLAMISVRGCFRLGERRACPHIKHVRAEALTSALQWGQ